MSNRCEICSLNFIDEYAFRGHLMGKKHMVKLEFVKSNIRRVQNSVYVSPLPPFATSQLVFDFFSKFGAIHHYNFNSRYLIVEFKDTCSVEYLLNNPIYLNNWKLQIARRRLDKRPRENIKKLPKNIQAQNLEVSASVDALRAALTSEVDLETQLTYFLSSIQCNKEQVVIVESDVCSSLEKIMKLSFPRCRAIPFGSSVTTLNLTGSDLDVFLDIGQPIVEDEKSPNSRMGWTPRTVFKEVKSLLFRHPSIFTKIVPIPAAKIPVIKCLHTLTGMECDLSFKHGLGVYNSQLTKYLLSLDSRIKPLILTLKYWAKNLNISGSGRINNYSLVMLIVFYLQQPSVNLLPPINDIQKINEKIYIRGWQVNFNKNYSYIQKNNSSSILELLLGFFKFYSDFDFSKTIICPVEGKSHFREDFKTEKAEVSDHVERLRLDRIACLQDPIQLDHNIISGWGAREVSGLKLSCLQGLEIFNTSKQSPLSILPKLLDPALRRKAKSAKPVILTINAGKFERFGLPDNFEEQKLGTNQEFIERNWFYSVYKLMARILEQIFRLEVQMVSNNVEAKQMKIEEEHDVHSPGRDRILLSCSGKYLLHMGRKGKSVSVDPSISPIEKEAMISEELMKEKVGKDVEMPIKFEFLVMKKSKPLHALVELTDQQFTNKSFTHIANWIQCKMKSFVEKEIMHMVQYKKNIQWKKEEQ